MVVELAPDGTVRREWSAVGGDPWGRFSREVDYRKRDTTKPHRSHPNYVFELDAGELDAGELDAGELDAGALDAGAPETAAGGEIWVTRFEQKDAFRLEPAPGRIPIDVEIPHDGVVYGGRVYFTTVDGHLVIADPTGREAPRVHDLHEMRGATRSLGWCRGVHILGEDRVAVGFSRVRDTPFRENLKWVARRALGRLPAGPTRVAGYDLRAGEQLFEIDLEPAAMAVLFSIHSAAAPADEGG